jgi:hypothetical protein
MTDGAFRAKRCGVDLKSAKNGPSEFSEGYCHERRQDTVFPVDGFPAVVDIQSLGGFKSEVQQADDDA